MPSKLPRLSKSVLAKAAVRDAIKSSMMKISTVISSAKTVVTKLVKGVLVTIAVEHATVQILTSAGRIVKWNPPGIMRMVATGQVIRVTGTLNLSMSPTGRKFTSLNLVRAVIVARLQGFSKKSTVGRKAIKMEGGNEHSA